MGILDCKQWIFGTHDRISSIAMNAKEVFRALEINDFM